MLLFAEGRKVGSGRWKLSVEFRGMVYGSAEVRLASKMGRSLKNILMVAGVVGFLVMLAE